MEWTESISLSLESQFKFFLSLYIVRPNQNSWSFQPVQILLAKMYVKAAIILLLSATVFGSALRAKMQSSVDLSAVESEALLLPLSSFA